MSQRFQNHHIGKLIILAVLTLILNYQGSAIANYFRLKIKRVKYLRFYGKLRGRKWSKGKYPESDQLSDMVVLKSLAHDHSHDKVFIIRLLTRGRISQGVFYMN